MSIYPSNCSYNRDKDLIFAEIWHPQKMRDFFMLMVSTAYVVG